MKLKHHGVRRGTALVAAALLAVVGISVPASAGPVAAAISPAVPVAGEPNLGPNVYVFTPSMAQSDIQATVDAISNQQVSNQFGTERYALLFEPGTYGTAANPLIFQVGYYTEVAGLGSSPSDVTINGTVDVYNQCFVNPDGSPNCIALDNFWRSLSNLTINVAGGSGCQTKTEFWAVSQAAPMRRVVVNGGASLMDYCTAGPQYASGGFIADSSFTGGSIVNGSQQQFIVRNTNIDGWSNGVWNQVFVGSPGAPAQDFGGANPYTTLATSPESQERPFLTSDASGKWSVFVPALLQNSSGPSWAGGTTAGTSLPISKFFIATPSTSVAAMNIALALGKNLLLSPGVYNLNAPILVTRPDTVVLGLGFPTLIPQNGNAVLRTLDVPGVKLAGFLVDAGPVNSPVLLQLGTVLGNLIDGKSSDPSLVQDVFFRIGGATAGKATSSFVVDSPNTILDDIWVWRADHGAGVGWTDNTADNGLTVNGNNVLAYGLAVEHFQKNEVVWNGQGGEDIFFQNEMPYDPPSQAAWMSTPTTDGYPAFVISPKVKTFTGWGMGSYNFFENGIPIHSATGFVAPVTPGVQLNDVFTRFLSGDGGIDHVINDLGAPVTADNPGPSNILTFP